jgi:hypothetical protein
MLRAAETGVVPEIRALAARLRRDYAAVVAALAPPVGSAKRFRDTVPLAGCVVQGCCATAGDRNT